MKGLAFVVFILCGPGALGHQAGADHVPGEVVALVNGERTAQSKPGREAYDLLPIELLESLQQKGLASIQPLEPPDIAKTNPITGAMQPKQGLYVFRFSTGASVPALVKEISALPGIVLAEPNYIGTLSYTPSDPLYDETADHFTHVGMEDAWEVQQGGSPDVTVAVIDSGVDANHHDLAAALHPDSYNFVESNNNIFDDLGHGTRVAGIIGARGNDGQGIAGAAFGARILSCDVVDAFGVLTTARTISAINYAVARGVGVINMSIQFYAPSSLLKQACDNAASSAVLVASAGNENQGDSPVYPASYDSVIGVGATMLNSDNRAPFSNYNGAERTLVDLAAPGVSIFTTIPASGYDGVYTSGTSFAAPIVSGVAALLASKYPAQSPAAIRAHLEKTAQPIGAWAGLGLVSAKQSLEFAMKPSLFIASIAVDDSTAIHIDNDADGTWDAGEIVDIALSLTNSESDGFNIVGSVTTTNSSVHLTDKQTGWGNVRGGMTKSATDPITGSVALAGIQAQSVTFDLQMSGDGGYSDTLHFSIPIESATTPPTIIGTDTVWTSDKTYELLTNTIVMNSATLTIEPGARVRIAEDAHLEVRGGLIANGDKNNPIHFLADTASAPPVPSVDPVHNGRFGSSSGWTRWWEASDSNMNLDFQHRLYAPTGGEGSCLAIYGNNYFNGGVYQQITLEGGQTYTLNGYFRSSSSPAASCTWAEVHILPTRPTNGVDVGSNYLYVKSDSWSCAGFDHAFREACIAQQTTYTCSGTGIQTRYLLLKVGGICSTMTRVTFDSVSLIDVEATSPYFRSVWMREIASIGLFRYVNFTQTCVIDESLSGIYENCIFDNPKATYALRSDAGTSIISNCIAINNESGTGINASGHVLLNCEARGNALDGLVGRKIVNCVSEYNGFEGLVGDSVMDSTSAYNGGTGIATSSATGCISLYNAVDGIESVGTIRDCIVRGNGGWGVDSDGVIINTLAIGNANGLRGTVITDSTAQANTGKGIQATSTVSRCLTADNTGTGMTGSSFVECTVVRNGSGLTATGATIACTVSENTGIGISGGSVAGCVVHHNTSAGISNVSTVTNVWSVNNNGIGISASGDVTEVQVIGNAGGGIITPNQTRSAYVLSNAGNGVENSSLVTHCVIDANSGNGVQQGESILHSWITMNTGVGADRPSSVLESLISANGGIGIQGRTAFPYTNVTDSTIVDNSGSGIIVAGLVNGCNLYNNGGVAGFDYQDTRLSTQVLQVDVSGNYWGSVTTPMMDAYPWGTYYNIARIWDFLDDTSLTEARYANHLSSPAGTPAMPSPPVIFAPAFLLDVTPNLSNAVNVGLADFTLAFSEPMDITVIPVVTFDGAAPFTRNVAQPVGWLNNTTWRGTFAIGIGTGDGLNTIRVSKARSEDGFAIPDDTAHQFIIDTDPGTGVTNGVAIPLGNSAMRLEWDPSPNGDIIGYSIVRALAPAGPYDLIDSVAASITDYTDTGLAGATTYFYQIREYDASFNSRELTSPFFASTDSPTPTHTPLPTPTPTHTPLPTDTPTHTPLPTDTPTHAPLPTDTPTLTPSPTQTSTPEETPTEIPVTATATLSPAFTPTATPAVSPSPTFTPTASPSQTPPPSPTVNPAERFDLNKDGAVDEQDFMIFLEKWHTDSR